MIWRVFSLCVLVLFIQLPYAAIAQLKRSVADGLTLQQVRVADNKTITFLRVSLEKFDVRVLTPLVSLSENENLSNPERAARGLFLEDYRLRYGATAVMSGSWITTFSPPAPLGLVKSNGTITNSSHESWLVDAIFCSDTGRAEIKPKGTPVDRQEFRDCLQAGPLLLVNGSPATTTTSEQKRNVLARSMQEQTFVCIDRNKNVLMGVSDKINFQILVDFLRRPEIDCVDAMRLTGQASAGLRVNNDLFDNDDYLFPSAVGVIPRPSRAVR